MRSAVDRRLRLLRDNTGKKEKGEKKGEKRERE